MPSALKTRGSTHRWRKIRAATIAARGNRCERCSKEGGAGGAGLEVHHRHGRANGDQPSNLQVLCSNCHSAVDPWRRRHWRR